MRGLASRKINKGEIRKKVRKTVYHVGWQLWKADKQKGGLDTFLRIIGTIDYEKSVGLPAGRAFFARGVPV